MSRALLTAAAAIAIGSAFIAPAMAGDVLSPSEMNAFMTRGQPIPAAPYNARGRVIYDPGTTGSIVGGTVAPELWPPCPYGPPTCTAAGYPNLRYERENIPGYGTAPAYAYPPY